MIGWPCEASHPAPTLVGEKVTLRALTGGRDERHSAVAILGRYAVDPPTP